MHTSEGLGADCLGMRQNAPHHQMGWRVDHLIDPWRYVDAETAKSLETFDKWFVWMKDLIP